MRYSQVGGYSNGGDMAQSRKRFIPIAVIIILVLAVIAVCCAAVAAYYYFFKNRVPDVSRAAEVCKISHTRFDPEHPELVTGASSDQLAVLAVDGSPQAFTISIDPLSGSFIEEWDYFTTGRQLNFLDGVFQGGMEVPEPVINPGASIPEPSLYPWEIIEEFTPVCVVQLSGTALFTTSALVLPGWNDGYEVARLWMLAGGGSMITADGNLALLSIDLGEAIDLDQFDITGFYVGTLGEGDNRLGAILSPGDSQGTYRLSLSPRGQGTTQDGTEFIFDLEGTKLDQVYVLGTDARASIVDLEGSESPVQASGKITITRQGKNYIVNLSGRINDRDYEISGMLGNGFWKSSDHSTVQALGEALPLVEWQKANKQPAASITLQPVPGITSMPTSVAAAPTSKITSAEPEAMSDWELILYETFDDNDNNWPVSYSSDDEYLFYQSDLFQDQYMIFAERKSGNRPLVMRLIDYKVGPQFHISVEVTQEGNANSDCGLIVSTNDEAYVVGFATSAMGGEFRVMQREGSGNWDETYGWTTSQAIHPNQVNLLAMMGDSQGLSLYINDQQVGVVDIAGLDVQRLGLSASVGSEEPVVCYFDNLQVLVK
jgi:hypothetical protein